MVVSIGWLNKQIIMDTYTHVGAFAIVKAPPVVTTYTEKGCPAGHGRVQPGDLFCRQCGKPITDVPHSEARRVRLRDLLPGDDETLFSPWGVEGLDDDEIVVIGNGGRGGSLPDGDIIEVTSVDIERCKTEFAHAFSAEIAHLEKSATVTIKFGVINYVL